jgi:hypothetical protein
MCGADRRLQLSCSTVKDRIFHLQFYTPIRALTPPLAPVADRTTIAFFARTFVTQPTNPGRWRIANP